MKTNLKSILLGAFAVFALASCQEFQPVGHAGHYGYADAYKVYTDADFNSQFTSVATIKKLYKTPHAVAAIKNGVTIDKHYIMKVQVISDDVSGNIYKDLYVQDASVADPDANGEALCIKVGKGSMYADYKYGQVLYIDCYGLTIGQYCGSLGLGMKGYTTSVAGKSVKTYETSYIELNELIDMHIFRGAIADPKLKNKGVPQPVAITASQVAAITDCYHPLNGKLVTVKDIVYSDQIFGILNATTEQDDDRIFLSNTESDRTTPIYNSESFGLVNWSWSKVGSEAFFDSLCVHKVLQYYPETDTYMGHPEYSSGKYQTKVYDRQASSGTSVYFKFKGSDQDILVRTSGYAKFSDQPMNLAKGDAISIDKAILTYYNSKVGDSRYEETNRQYQLTVLYLDDIKYAN